MFDFDDRDIDNQYESQLIEYDLSHPICPECFAHMYEQRESYNIDNFYFKEKWFECPNCGHCTKI